MSEVQKCLDFLNKYNICDSCERFTRTNFYCDKCNKYYCKKCKCLECLSPIEKIGYLTNKIVSSCEDIDYYKMLINEIKKDFNL